MPATPKALLIVSAVIEGLVGLFAIIAPVAAVEQAYPNIGGGLGAAMAMRTLGAALLSLGVLSWLAREATEPAVLKPALGALTVYNVLAFAHFGLLATGPVPTAVAPAVLHFLLSGGFIYYLRKQG